MRHLYGALLLLASITGTGQSYYSMDYDINNGSEAGWDIAYSGDKIAVLVGALCNQNATACVELLHLDKDGNLQWSLLLDTMDIVYGESLITTDTAIYFAGVKQGNQRLGIRLMQFDWDANLVREIDLTEEFPYSSVNNLSLVDSTLVLSFNKRGDDEHFSPTPDTTYYYFMNQELEYLRHHKISSGTFRFEVGFGYHKAQDGSGYYSDRFGSVDAWHDTDSLDILKFDHTGNLLWSHRVAPEEESGGGYSDIVTTVDGGLVALWHVQDWETVEPIYTAPSRVIKLSSEGEWEWEYTFNAVNLRNVSDIFLAPNGDIICVGIEYLYNLSEENQQDIYAGWIGRVTQEGTFLWGRTILDTRFLEILNVMQFYRGIALDDGSLMMTGIVADTIHNETGQILYNSNTWVVRTDNLGCIHSGCEELDIISSTPFVLPVLDWSYSIFPNPASEEVIIQLNENVAGQPIDIFIFNAMGRKIISKQLKGLATTLNISDLSKGIYYIRLIGESGKSSIQKLVKN